MTPPLVPTLGHAINTDRVNASFARALSSRVSRGVPPGTLALSHMATCTACKAIVWYEREDVPDAAVTIFGIHMMNSDGTPVLWGDDAPVGMSPCPAVAEP